MVFYQIRIVNEIKFLDYSQSDCCKIKLQLAFIKICDTIGMCIKDNARKEISRIVIFLSESVRLVRGRRKGYVNTLWSSCLK